MPHTFLDDVVLPRDPQASMQAATKQYVDGKTGAGGTQEVYAQTTEPVVPIVAIWADTTSPQPPGTGGDGGGGAATAPATFMEPCRVVARNGLNPIAGLLTIDGVTLSEGDRVLVTNQGLIPGPTGAIDNGIYLASSGPWERAPDANTTDAIKMGSHVFIHDGNTLSSTLWYCYTTGDSSGHTPWEPGVNYSSWSNGINISELYVTGISWFGSPVAMPDGSQVKNESGPATLTVDGSTYSGTYYKVGGNTRYFLGADSTAWKLSPFTDAGSQDDSKAMTFYRASGNLTVGGDLLTVKAVWLLEEDPQDNNHAASKWYVDQRVLKTGDTMTGPLTLYNARLDMDQSPAAWIPIRLKVGGQTRWEIGCGGGGTRLDIDRWVGGAYASTPITIYTSSGNIGLEGDIEITKDTPSVVLNSVTPTERYVRFRTAGKDRWTFGAVPNAETGGNAGSDFSVARWADDGTWLDNPITIDRANGVVTILKPLMVGAVDSTLTLKGSTSSNIVLDTPTTTNTDRNVRYKTNGVDRWSVGAEPDAGSMFSISAYNDAGSWSGNAIEVLRSDKRLKLYGDPTAPLHAATKQYIDNRTPKITVGTTAPSNPSVGDLWVDTN